MPLLNVHLQDVNAEAPPVMEAGTKDLKSVKVKLVAATSTKEAILEVTFKDVTGGIEDGRTLLNFFHLNERSMYRLKQWLQAAGEAELAESDQIDTDLLCNLVAQAVVVNVDVVKEATGKVSTYANVDEWIRPEVAA